MTATPALPAHYLHPASKASSTSKDSRLSAIANSSPATSRSTSEVRPVRARQKNASSGEYSSEKATASLIRRVLGPQTGIDPRTTPRPIHETLPPLTSSNEVDLQLYALISVVVKEYVQTWYSKITPDHVFVEEMVHIIAHCSRAVEQRLRRIDVAELLFDDISALVEGHILAYRTVQESCSTYSYPSASLQKYHALNPHPALSPFPHPDQAAAVEAQGRNETIYRQFLVQGALAVLLPTEDLQNSCLRTLVSDILADLILGQALCGKVCQGWFLNEAVIKIVEVVKSHIQPKARGDELEQHTRGRLEKFGLLSCKEETRPAHSSTNDQSRGALSSLFWRLLQYVYLFILSVRFVVAGLYRARSSPPRSHSSELASSSPIASTAASPSTPARSWSSLPTPPQPILSYRIFNLLSTLLDLSTRMPWLAGLVSLGKHAVLNGPGQLGATNGVVDKFLHSILTSHLTPWPTLLPTILLNLRINLFPFNARSNANLTSPPTAEEQLRIRRRAAEAILSLIPQYVARIYFAIPNATTNNTNNTNNDPDSGKQSDIRSEPDTEAQLDQIEEDLLLPFSEDYLNRHLVYNILETVIARLAPEMAGGGSGVSELLAERGVVSVSQ